VDCCPSFIKKVRYLHHTPPFEKLRENEAMSNSAIRFLGRRRGGGEKLASYIADYLTVFLYSYTYQSNITVLFN